MTNMYFYFMIMKKDSSIIALQYGNQITNRIELHASLSNTYLICHLVRTSSEDLEMIHFYKMTYTDMCYSRAFIITNIAFVFDIAQKWLKGKRKLTSAVGNSCKNLIV